MPVIRGTSSSASTKKKKPAYAAPAAVKSGKTPDRPQTQSSLPVKHTVDARGSAGKEKPTQVTREGVQLKPEKGTGMRSPGSKKGAKGDTVITKAGAIKKSPSGGKVTFDGGSRTGGAGTKGGRKTRNLGGVTSTSGGGGRAGGGGVRDIGQVRPSDIRGGGGDGVRSISNVRPTDPFRGSMSDRDLVGSYNEIETFEGENIVSGGGGGTSNTAGRGVESVAQRLGSFENVEGQSLEEVTRGARRREKARKRSL